MPQVTVKYDSRYVKLHGLLAAPIAGIVAEALSCPDYALVKEDVEVEFKPFGIMDEMRGYSVIIQVDANDFPSRKINLQERNDNIAEGLKFIFATAQLIPEGTGRKAFVWTRLMPAGFTTFKI